MDSYDPWQVVDRRPDVTVVLDELPAGQRGRIDFRTSTITLERSLPSAARRCTLAHELVHLERGPVLLRLVAREERVVAAIAARRLVPLASLARVLAWTIDVHELAEELGVDARTIRTRMATLCPDDVAQLRRLGGRRPPVRVSPAATTP